MSDRLVSGSGRFVKVSVFVLYSGLFDIIRRAFGQIYMRISLPVRMVSGFAVQDSDQKVFHSEIVAAALSEIHHFGRDGLAAGRLPGR